MTAIDFCELIVRWVFALQMLFWGLNGFFHWVAIPPASKKFDQFVQACIEVRFLMPTVKIIEIVFSIFLLSDFLTTLSILIFTPLIFVISGLQIFCNPRPAFVLLTCCLPFALLIFLNISNLKVVLGF